MIGPDKHAREWVCNFLDSALVSALSTTAHKVRCPLGPRIHRSHPVVCYTGREITLSIKCPWSYKVMACCNVILCLQAVLYILCTRQASPVAIHSRVNILRGRIGNETLLETTFANGKKGPLGVSVPPFPSLQKRIMCPKFRQKCQGCSDQQRKASLWGRLRKVRNNPELLTNYYTAKIIRPGLSCLNFRQQWNLHLVEFIMKFVLRLAH